VSRKYFLQDHSIKIPGKTGTQKALALNNPLIIAIKMNILSNNRAVIPCRMDILRLHTNHNYLSLSEVNKEACRRPDTSTKC
jgi:hypothetical protein